MGWVPYHGSSNSSVKEIPAIREISWLLAGMPQQVNLHSQRLSLGFPKLRPQESTMNAVYTPGVQYIPHTDTNEKRAGDPSWFTLLAYFNIDWTPADGGQLRIYDTEGLMRAQKTEDAASYDIEPLPGRVIAFRAREVWHAVLPAKSRRHAMTLWCDAEPGTSKK